MSRKLGILGGMGPLATADFFYKLTQLSKASRDQDHIETVIYSASKIPDRTSAIMSQGPSPLPAMLDGVALLEQAGASVIAIPCNTAHHWHPDLVARACVPVLHIAECACEALIRTPGSFTKVGVLATSGTLRTRIYQEPLEQHGFIPIIPTDAQQSELVQPAIALVKAGEVARARAMLENATDALVSAGATQVIMGCTEIPVALEGSSRGAMLVDATAALAAACIAFCHERHA